MSDLLPELPFEEAIEFLKGKVQLPTERWTDLWEGQHARAFVTAGATKADLLADMHGAVTKAIEQGTTLQDFRKSFDELVARHGWDYNGSRNWRSRLIYETNLRSAYQAGRYKRMSDPEVLRDRPFWEYVHGASAEPRKEHLAWHGMVLRADDPWWQQHYPPNGWGCTCRVRSMSQRDLDREGKSGPDEAPPVETRTWTAKTGETEEVPVGVDPGWAYNVGEARWGQKHTWRTLAKGEKGWARLPSPGRIDDAHTEKLPRLEARYDKLKVPVDQEQAGQFMTEFLGQEEKLFVVGKGEASIPVLVNTQTLARHIKPNDLDRTAYFSWAIQALEQPQEVWLSFWRSRLTDKVVLRPTVLAHIEGHKNPMLVVVDVEDGVFRGWTFYPASHTADARKGYLLYPKGGSPRS